MRKEAVKKGDWASFFAVLVVFALMAFWAFVPVKVMEGFVESERKQIHDAGGEQVLEWIDNKSSAMLVDFGAAQEAIKGAHTLGNNPFELWLIGRLYISILWGKVAAIRLATLSIVFLLGFPFLIGASIDGYYVREVRKTEFISQSPIRHQLGVYLFRAVSMLIAAWLLVPLPMPIIFVPLSIVLAGLSLWMWVGNLQKRM